MEKNRTKKTKAMVEKAETMTFEKMEALGQAEYAEAMRVKDAYNLFLEEEHAKTFIEKIHMAALHGNVTAMCEWGERLIFPMYRIVLEKDEAEGVRWLRKSAERGCGRAAFRMGEIYDYGWYGVKQDSLEAVAWYRKSNSYECKYKLAWHYYSGDGVQQNTEEALQLFIRAEQGYNRHESWNPAAFNLGLFYLHGNGVEINGEMALYYLKRAQNAEEALYELGEIYYHGLAGVEKNYTKASYWYLAAATRGNPRAILQMAQMFETGEGVEVNKTESIHMYELIVQYFDEDKDYDRSDNFQEAYDWAYELAQKKIDLMKQTV